MNKSPADELLQGHLAQTVNIQRIPAHEKGKVLQLFRGTFRIGAEQNRGAGLTSNLRRTAAYRTDRGNLHLAVSRQVFLNLGNDHVGLIDRDPVSRRKPQLPHDTHIVDAGPAHRGSLQLHRLKYRHRVDKPRPGRTPLDILKGRLADLIPPLEGNGIPGKFGRPPQGIAVGDVVIQKHQAVGGDVVALDGLRKLRHSIPDGLPGYLHPVYHLKSLTLQPFKLLLSGVFKIHALRLHQAEGEEIHISLCGNLAVQLSDRTAAEVPRILVLCVRIADLRIDLLKLRIADDGLAPEDQLALIGDIHRQIGKYFRIPGDDFPDFPVSAGYRLHKSSVPVGENNRQPVHFPGKQALLVSQPLRQLVHALGLCQRQHRLLVAHLRQLTDHLIAHVLGRASRENHAGFLLQRRQFIIERIIFIIAHDLPALLVVGPRRRPENLYQFSDPRSLLIVCHDCSSSSGFGRLAMEILCALFRWDFCPSPAVFWFSNRAAVVFSSLGAAPARSRQLGFSPAAPVPR